MTKYCIIALLVCNFCLTYSQQDKADSLYSLARNYTRQSASDSAIKYYQLAEEQYYKEEKVLTGLLSKLRMGDEFGIIGDYYRAYQIMGQVIKEGIKRNSNSLLLEAYRTRGLTEDSQRKTDLALISYDSALYYGKTLDTRTERIRVARLNRNIAITYALGHNPIRALKYFEQCKEIYDSLQYISSSSALINHDIGITNVTIGRYYKAIDNFQNALEIYQSLEGELPIRSISLLHSSMGDAYLELGTMANAIDEYEKAIDILKSSDNSKVYLGRYLLKASTAYLRNGQNRTALQYIEEAISINKSTYGTNHRQTLLAYSAQGDYYSQIKEYAKASQSYQVALNIFSKLPFGQEKSDYAKIRFNLGLASYMLKETTSGLSQMTEAIQELDSSYYGQGFTLTEAYNRLANLYLELSQPDSAFINFNRAKVVSHYSTNDTLSYDFEKEHSSYPLQYFKAVIGIIRSFYLKYQQEKNNTYLNAAYNEVNTIHFAIDQLRQSSDLTDTQLYISELLSKSITTSIEVCHQLYEKTQSSKFLIKALQLMEMNKANTILSSNTEKFELERLIPDSLLFRSREIRAAMLYVETELSELSTLSAIDSSKTNLLKDQLLKLKAEQLKYIQQIKEDFPFYYSLKYNVREINESSIFQNLDKGEVIVNYHLGADKLYMIGIARNNYLSFHKIKIGNEFNGAISQFLSTIKEPNQDQAQERFIQVSNELVSYLFPNLDDFKNFRKITIIPDGLLHSIPFEAFVKNTVNKNPKKELEYFINDHSIRYAPSFNFLIKQNKTTPSTNKVLAMAPYVGSEESPTTFFLPHSKEEIFGIAGHFKNTTQLTGKSATEESFKDLSDEYEVIHFATHAIVDSKNSLFSKLLFSTSDDSDMVNEGDLYAREILNLKVPSNMIVLSACSSGTGDILPGEGIMSLATSFYHAGAKSVVPTLWTANDESTSKIVDKFYENLAQGQGKSTALRNAKIWYLNNSKGIARLPYFWAHFVVTGDDSPIVNASLLSKYWKVLIIVMITIFGTIFLIRQKNSRIPS